MKIFAIDLRVSASGLALVAGSLSTTAALAQPAAVPAPEPVAAPASAPLDTSAAESEIIVTGTSIRGTAPVGSNLISVGRDEIAKTAAPSVTQMLQTVPALSNMGNAGRGGNGNGGVGASVYIHQIGASAQNSTLVLVDGHRIPASGTTSSVVDPNNIPGVMLERVEVLAEGASSVYGSDAVAGVVNFITRRKFDGIEVRGQITQMDRVKPGLLGSVIAGQSWATGSAIVAYQYSFEDELTNTDRPITNPLGQPARADAAGLTGPGSTNFGNFNCSPATIQPNGTGNIYLNPTSGTNVANAAANQPCSQWAYGSILPKEVRHNAMIKVTQELTDTLTLNTDFTYSKRRSTNRVSRGTLTATAFGPGGSTVAGQANPFYINPPGVTAGRQQIRYDFNDLYGPGAYAAAGDEALYGSATLTWKAYKDWEINALAVAGRSSSYSGENVGTVNTALASLYLNGTAQASGNTTLPSLPGGGNTITLNLPLTTQNALDVWTSGANNRTSQAVRDALLNSRNLNRQTNSVEQVRLSASGSVIDLPAGPLKVAIGAEYVQYGILQDRTNPLALAGATVASQYARYKFDRHVTSEYIEANIPVIGPEMNIPAINKLDVNVSLRHDKYSDFGNTTNPKASFNWDIVEGLRIRGNASKSFVAPGLNVIGKPYGNANFAGVSTVTNNVNIPIANYPTLRQFPICANATTTCNISSLQGIQGNVGDPNNGPQKGKGWSIGVDLAPRFLSGFRASATLWDVTFLGGITNPAFNITVNTASIANRVIFYPNCATPADVAATVGTQPVLNLFPSCISYIGIGNNGNYLNFFTRGLDINLSYSIRTEIGTFTIGDDITHLLKFNQGFAARGQKPTPEQTFSVKNTVGLNTTFPNVGTQMRGHLGWADDSLNADLYVNYTGSYKNVSGTARNPIQLTSAGVYSGEGGDKVKAQATFDLTLGYKFSPGFVGDSQLQLRIRNLFDKNPPYFNSAAGYDTYVANVLGRSIALSLSVKM